MMSIKLSGIIITEAFFGIKLSEKYYSSEKPLRFVKLRSVCQFSPKNQGLIG